MEEKILYSQKSQYRDDFRVKGFSFGSGRKALAVVGATRGNERQQMYVCSQLVKRLAQVEESGHLAENAEILVIPCVNPWSMNIHKRFWSIDNTDINRMFPGYNLGETTQRIAAGIFDAVRDYDYGVQLASFYMKGLFAPHIRIMKTGFEEPEMARLFGLPYVILRKPRPFDTTTLNFNWQIWETHAFSLYTTNTEFVNRESASMAVNAILRFMTAQGLVTGEPLADDTADSRIVSDESLVTVRAEQAGFFHGEVKPGCSVKAGEELAQIEDSYDGHVLEHIIAPANGVILFMHDDDLCFADSAVYKIIV